MIQRARAFFGFEPPPPAAGGPKKCRGGGPGFWFFFFWGGGGFCIPWPRKTPGAPGLRAATKRLEARMGGKTRGGRWVRIGPE